MPQASRSSTVIVVAPHAGAWIEMTLAYISSCRYMVAPHAGAWIEIVVFGDIYEMGWDVVPHAGAWIEIILSRTRARHGSSLPTRERGLKYKLPRKRYKYNCRSPRGSVD